MPEPALGPSGFLLLLSRTFDSVPFGFYSDRSCAEEAARSMLAAYDPDAPAKGQPRTGPGELGPPGLFSRVFGIVLIPYVGGLPAEEGRCYFSPEVPERGRGRMSAAPAEEDSGLLAAHGIPQKKRRKRKEASV
jgi:hypothetical protein